MKAVIVCSVAYTATASNIGLRSCGADRNFELEIQDTGSAFVQLTLNWLMINLLVDTHPLGRLPLLLPRRKLIAIGIPIKKTKVVPTDTMKRLGRAFPRNSARVLPNVLAIIFVQRLDLSTIAFFGLFFLR